MKAWVKGIIAGAVIAAIGVAVFIGGLWLNGWKMPNINYSFEMRTYTSENADLTNLKLDLDAGPLKTEFYDGETVMVEYPECEDFGYEIAESNGLLEVKPVKSFWHWFRWGTVNIPTATLKLPKGVIYDLELYMGAGMITQS